MTGLRERTRRLVRRGRSRLQRHPSLMRAGIYMGRLVVQLWRKFIGDDCLEKASAMAYTTILAIIPLLAVSMLVFRLSGAFQGMEERVRGYLVDTLLADSVGEVVSFLDLFMNRISSGAVGVAGLTFLIVTATWLFVTAETAINRIWRAPLQRGILARFTTFWSLVTLGPVLLAMGLYLTSQFQNTSVGRALQDLPFLQTVTGLIVPYLFSVLALTMVYKLVPNTRVRWRAAIVGALVAGVLFELSKQGFNLYVSQLYQGGAKAKIYGAFALFPVFLLWIYIAWVIAFFGAVVAYTVQNLDVLYDAEMERRIPAEQEHAALSPYLACRIMLVIAWRHFVGRPPMTGEEVIRASRAPEAAVGQALERLVKGDLVMVLVQDESPVYVPARDIGRIALDDALRAYQAAALGPDGRAGDPARALDDLFCDLSIRQAEVTGGFSFRDLVEAAPQGAFDALFHQEEPLPEVTAPKPPPEPLPDTEKEPEAR